MCVCVYVYVFVYVRACVCAFVSECMNQRTPEVSVKG